MITDFRINAKGELEGKVIPPAKWEEMYTKDDIVAMLTEIQLEIEEVKTQSGFDEAWDGAVKQCSEIIQQKIDLLRSKKGT